MPRCRDTSGRESLFGGTSGVAFSAAPKRFGSGSPFRLVLQPRSVSPWSATPKMHWSATSPGGSDGQGPRHRARRNASDSVFPSSHAFGPMPASSAVHRSAETHWFAASPIDGAFEAAVPPRRSATVRRFRRLAFSQPSGWVVFRRIERALDRILDGRPVVRENPSNQAFRLPQARSFTGAPKRSGSSPCRRRSRPRRPPPRRRSVEDRALPSG